VLGQVAHPYFRVPPLLRFRRHDSVLVPTASFVQRDHILHLIIHLLDGLHVRNLRLRVLFHQNIILANPLDGPVLGGVNLRVLGGSIAVVVQVALLLRFHEVLRQVLLGMVALLARLLLKTHNARRPVVAAAGTSSLAALLALVVVLGRSTTSAQLGILTTLSVGEAVLELLLALLAKHLTLVASELARFVGLRLKLGRGRVSLAHHLQLELPSLLEVGGHELLLVVLVRVG